MKAVLCGINEVSKSVKEIFGCERRFVVERFYPDENHYEPVDYRSFKISRELRCRITDTCINCKTKGYNPSNSSSCIDCMYEVYLESFNDR